MSSFRVVGLDSITDEGKFRSGLNSTKKAWKRLSWWFIFLWKAVICRNGVVYRSRVSTYDLGWYLSSLNSSPNMFRALESLIFETFKVHPRPYKEPFLSPKNLFTLTHSYPVLQCCSILYVVETIFLKLSWLFDAAVSAVNRYIAPWGRYAAFTSWPKNQFKESVYVLK